MTSITLRNRAWRIVVVACAGILLLAQILIKDSKTTKHENCSGGSDYRYSYPSLTGRTGSNNSNSSSVAAFKTEEGEFQVPNIVHYIWYADKPRELKFHHMLSILSAHRFIRPEKILFHTNKPPVGEFWERVRSEVTELVVVNRTPSTCLFGERLEDPYFETSQSNVDRVRVLLENGGIYLDLDVLVVRPFTELRRYPCVIGLQSADHVCGGIIVGSRHSFFLTLWANSFLDDYRREVWAYNTGEVPYKLWRRFPHLVHVERHALHKPGYKDVDRIWNSWAWPPVPWRNKYAVHLWYRIWKKKSPYSATDPDYTWLDKYNSTFTQLANHILR